MKKPIQFVYFDLGGVLVDHFNGLSRIARNLDIAEEAMIDFFIKHIAKVDSGNSNWVEMEKKFYQTMEPNKKISIPLLHYFVDHINSIGPVHRLVYELADQFKIGILSDIAVDGYERIVFKKLVPQISYAAEIISGKVGFLKPSREIFEYAAKAAGVPVETILFIDDRPRNVEAARSFGWQALLFDREQPEKSVSEIKKILF